MRALLSILAGFFLGVLALGTGLEWLLSETAGECSPGCPAWRDWVPWLVTLGGWVFCSLVVYLAWERIRPREAATAYEERIRHLKRGGR